MEPMPWDRDAPFVVGNVVRPARRARKPQTGDLAVRFPYPYGAAEYFAPAALVTQPDPDVSSFLLRDARDPHLLVCAVAPDPEDNARYRVTDARHRELGHIHRTPAHKRTIQHTWWIRQSGHPDIVAGYAWAKGTSKDVASRGVSSVGRIVGGVVESAIFGPGDGGSGSTKQNTVTWRADDEVVMTSGYLEGVRAYRPATAWLDRRLAFALAVLRQG
ncbi:hypothetical protein [Embleya sp. NBC_00896]|uniref:hypothetical protein n=1 Tax=Embleya sp. NBC_00896 TaxID=2975961 RepID=UPI003865C980|nr:hypothetical protein OG928_00190 [Embleya sp. NBC_00896]